jgi:hypothetical protein
MSRVKTLPRSLVLLPAVLAAATAVAQLSGPEFRLSMNPDGTQMDPRVAIGTGQFVVVWSGAETIDGSLAYSIFARRFSRAGVPLGVTDHLAGQVQSQPRVAAAGSDFLIVWSTGFVSIEDSSNLYAQRYSGTSGPSGTAFIVNASTSGAQGNAAVAGDAVHGYVVAWSSSIGGAVDVYARRYHPDLSPKGGEFRVNSVTTGNQSRPSVALSGTGSFVVAYQSDVTGGSTGSNVYAQRFSSAGVLQGQEFRPHEELNGDQQAPSVGADSSGDFVIAWQAADGNGTGVFARTYASSGAPLADEYRVNSVTTGAQDQPAVAVSDTGVVIAWQDTRADLNLGEIYARRYAGGPVGEPFRVNTGLTGDQDKPHVAVSPDGREHVVVWESDANDAGDVLGRKLCLGGDANNDGALNVNDVFFLINHLFSGGPSPVGCADVNGTLTLDVTDVFYLINHLFAAGPAPV